MAENAGDVIDIAEFVVRLVCGDGEMPKLPGLTVYA